ncbi:MAG: Endonuclease/Exonuclease/phosphatase family protein [Chlorobi bacterium OLB5]|nr:MAG: Endonuclease/Exonuclease/phosphatase family protein [Chlorobi bacterium OLB5]
MKLITWNCQGAFRRKIEFILALKPDILIVQECENPNKINYSSTNLQPKNFYWYGDSLHKGISVYSYSEYKFELLNEFNPEFRYILPFRVTGHEDSFILFAIWAMSNKENYEARYIGQIWQAINYYSGLFNCSTILIGDFNSNKIWDYKKRVGDHTDVVNKLAEYNIHSIYHKYFKVEQGKEIHPTFFLQRNLNKPYHIDYCFASSDFIKKVKSVEIGSFENWNAHSDHSPLIINFDTKK